MRTELNAEEQAWLDKNETYVDQDNIKEVNLLVSPYILSNMAERAPHTLAEMINNSNYDVSALPDMSCLSKLEAELIRLTFVENMSTRQISGAVMIITTVDGKVISSQNMPQQTISRAIINAIGKLKTTHLSQNAYSKDK